MTNEEISGPSFFSIGEVLSGWVRKWAKTLSVGTGSGIELDAAIRAYSEFKDQIQEAVRKGEPFCESPIEQYLLPWLVAQEYYPFEHRPALLLPSELGAHVQTTAAVVPQLAIGRFRADFAIAVSGNGALRFLIVECDGAEFHQGEENQAKDRERDAIITTDRRVFGIIRITGSDIYRNPENCARRVAERLRETWRFSDKGL